MSNATHSKEFSLSDLTAKQRETMELIGDGLTTKEIAHRLDLSLSGATQRIEKVRNKFGGASKAELGRIYREAIAQSENLDSSFSTSRKNPLPDESESTAFPRRDEAGSHLFLGDSLTFNAASPWTRKLEPQVVPEVLDGENATTLRWAVTVGIAVGIVVLMLVLLAVSNSLGELY